MSILFGQRPRFERHSYNARVEVWEGGPRRLDWRIEFALLVGKAGLVAAVVAIAAIIVIVPYSTLRSWFPRTHRANSGPNIPGKATAPATAATVPPQNNVRLAANHSR